MDAHGSHDPLIEDVLDAGNDLRDELLAEVERLKRVVASMDDDLAARSREWAMEHGEDEDAVWTAVQFIEHYAASTGEGT